MTDLNTDDLPAVVGERHVLQSQEELRVEVGFGTGCFTICLQKGSCEMWGCELAVGKKYQIQNGGLKLALFTWHGCVVDVDGDIEISYTTDETDANICFVNTHAQLEALRDEAAAAIAAATASDNPSSAGSIQGPRVMILGPPESGKSSLAKTLVGYATKIGRTPLWVDLDPVDNAISVPGTLTVAPMTASAVTVETYATTGLPPSSVHPLVMWHGTTNKLMPDLFRAQVDKLAKIINARLETDENARASGVIVNTNGWIQDEGYPLLLHAAEALDIGIILIMGHDRLYSMMTNHFKKNPSRVEKKVLKLQRSGGVVSRPETFIRHSRSRAVKRYFYGDLVDPPKSSSDAPSSSTTSAIVPGGAGASSMLSSSGGKVPQLTPFLLQLNFSEVKIYKQSSMALSRSLLPVAQQQTTDAIQIVEVDLDGGDGDADQLQHALLAVCHPAAVEAFEKSGRARDLVCTAAAGFCAVERVMTDTDMLHLLSPCAGSLPSKTLLLGDITWME